jgi:DNA-binding transcriptional regulator YiaG
MPNLAAVFKDEIRRLARKEIRSELAVTRKASAQYRRDIAALKRQVAEQSRLIQDLKRAGKREASAGAESEVVARFSPKWMQAHREKLGLSAADYAALIGVSGQTVYNWEKGITRPQAQQLKAWSLVRKLGKREALRRLEEME